jgi:hypothetical protein
MLKGPQDVADPATRQHSPAGDHARGQQQSVRGAAVLRLYSGQKKAPMKGLFQTLLLFFIVSVQDD